MKPGPVPHEGPEMGQPVSGSPTAAGQKRGGSLSDKEEPPERVFYFNHQRSKTSRSPWAGDPQGPWVAPAATKGCCGHQAFASPAPRCWAPHAVPSRAAARRNQGPAFLRDSGVLLTVWLWPCRKPRHRYPETRRGVQLTSRWVPGLRL